MKKERLKLKDIEVESFVTTSKSESKTIQGGDQIDPLGETTRILEQTVSNLPGLQYGCLITATGQITATTVRITATAAQSNQIVYCVGNSRIGCVLTEGQEFC